MRDEVKIVVEINKPGKQHWLSIKTNVYAELATIDYSKVKCSNALKPKDMTVINVIPIDIPNEGTDDFGVYQYIMLEPSSSKVHGIFSFYTIKKEELDM